MIFILNILEWHLALPLTNAKSKGIDEKKSFKNALNVISILFTIEKPTDRSISAKAKNETKAIKSYIKKLLKTYLLLK